MTVNLSVWRVSKTVIHKPVLSIWNVPYKPPLTQCWRCGSYTNLPFPTSPIYWTLTLRLLMSYTGCPRRKGQNFGTVFLMLKYTDITQNTYIQSWTVTEKMDREKCGLLAGLRTVPCQLIVFRMSVLDCRVRLQKFRWRSYVSTPLWLTMHVMYNAWNP